MFLSFRGRDDIVEASFVGARSRQGFEIDPGCGHPSYALSARGVVAMAIEQTGVRSGVSLGGTQSIEARLVV